MKKPAIIIAALAVSLVIAIFYVIKPPSDVQVARDLIQSLHDSNRPQLGPLSSWDLHINTYDHPAQGSTIKDLYHQTCRRLEALYPGQLQSYFWRDVEGYPRWVTIVPMERRGEKPQHLRVSAYENNDNDSFRFALRDGKFSVEAGEMMSEKGKERTKSWALPPTSFQGSW
ncbi:hypothetical protein [Armatimonas rosea]|uniref:Uncharacterized protein n=1 Tax=Armatimonas rosea TaxID=685828 RepID=A0A7W9SPZ2_ARMRO|nr:hypothetical protein [Armatimonas rosea]MBB6050707.1 hypothetical protein [Armatimonas rosea]